MELPERRRLTLEEYSALEAVSSDRLEYRDGYAFALAVPNKNSAFNTQGRVEGRKRPDQSRYVGNVAA